MSAASCEPDEKTNQNSEGSGEWQSSQWMFYPLKGEKGPISADTWLAKQTKLKLESNTDSVG